MAMVEIAFGFANATQITFGDNRTECQFAAEDLYYNADFARQVLLFRWFNYFDIWKALDLFLYVPYNLYTIQYSCTESFYEVNELFYKYWSFTSNFEQIYFNLFYSGGNILKGMVNVAMYFMAKEYTRVDDPYSMGMELG